MSARPKFTGTKIAVGLSTAALAVAVLGGTPLGHAASSLVVRSHSVGTKQLKNNAVTSAKVRNGSLTSVDFKAGQLPAGPAGPAGQKGDPGPQGPKGDAGPAGVSGFTVVTAWSPELAPGEWGAASAGCPSGTQAIGGGVNSGQPLAIDLSAPNGQYWSVSGKNVGVVKTQFKAYAVCASVSS